MPFTNNRIYVVIILVVIVVIAGLAIANYQPKAKVKGGQYATVTLDANIGVEQIYIINLNTGGENTKTYMNLPYSFNCTVGHTIQVYAYTRPGYEFVTWEFMTGTFQSDNPLTLKINGDFTITGTTMLDYGSVE